MATRNVTRGTVVAEIPDKIGRIIQTGLCEIKKEIKRKSK